ncbi:hypothetical protein SLEP1_g6298 [Rubroshorea leprosula]|uniref:CCHC-type domain-containing protein n=1 Tax=Rubroshorea leprosula TaxID=152421 RepID=A0AAV5I5K0_9ROSI|nr:hypothetical protein SLEP1_g6298 [Rubroshorea leprosula]
MGCGGGRGHRGAQGGKNNRNSSNKYNNRNTNACQLCNNFGHVARNCPKLKNHAHVANFVTTSTSKKDDWWIDFGASDHVTLDFANLALHLEYDEPNELLIGGGLGSHYRGDASSSAQSTWRVPATNSKLVDSLIKLMENTFSIKDLDKFGMDVAKSVPPPPNGYYLSSLAPRSQTLKSFSAGDKDTLQSTTGFIVFLDGTPISWRACKQKAVARSSTEAEYRALATASFEVIGVCNLLHELGHPVSYPLAIYYDNIGATHLSSNPIMHTRMKHIAIDLHFVHELVHRKLLWVNHISTVDQLADGLTKPLSLAWFS